MSLDKGIKHGKEKREEYRGSKAFCKICRNNGDCPVCRENRLHSTEKRKQKWEEGLKDG